MNFRIADSLWAEIESLAKHILVCWSAPSILLILGSPATAVAATLAVSDAPCPLGAIAVEPGASIQAAVDSAGDGAVFCLKNGMHRMQVVRPRPGQSFFGEGHTVLNGSRLLTNFSREGRYWVGRGHLQPGNKHGECIRTAPACNLPESVFIDDKPLSQVLSKDRLESDRFYFDYTNGKIYLTDDPRNRKVEATVAASAFESMASDVQIRNITVEKYASIAQKGAIHAREGTEWTIENCEVRLNSGAGISIGTGGRVRNCDIHHNGQIGIEGNGRDIRIEGNGIWSNNVYGFDPAWEAGGVKIAESDGVAFLGNHVYDNYGVGLWCDINCRNIVYEDNLVESNQYSGIFHEISFNAVIRNNVLRYNGRGDRGWFWGADITIAASQGVEVTANTVTVALGGCGIVLIDQGRRSDDGKKYKTRNNTIHANEMTFVGSACVGGVSDTKPDDENFAIITDGNNSFDGNVYRVPRMSGLARFVWGHKIMNWDEFRQRGLEHGGQLVFF